MSEKTTAEVAAEYRAAYDSLAPLRNAVQEKVDAAITTAKAFFKEKNWRPTDEESCFAAMTGHSTPSGGAYVNASNIVDDSIWFQIADYNGVAEDYVLRFSVIDNPLLVLEAEYAVYITEKTEREAEWTRHRREKLEAELAELDK